MLVWFYALVALTLSYPIAGAAVVGLHGTRLSGVSLPTLQQEFFGGIPFAEPPIGPLRFAPPILKLNPGVPVFNATQFGNACTQAVSSAIDTGVSEDCLTINVLRSSGLKANDSVPVMVWVYGGGFLSGASSLFNGSSIVGQASARGTPVIYVNLNYRIGPLGFPQGREAERQGLTNLGNKDILAALTWIQHNIAAFGGDKDKVTIFGESAGAILIAQLLLNQNFNLARAAILESGSAASNSLFRASDPPREEAWQDFVSAVPECKGAARHSTLGCLRSASSDTILNATASAFGKIQEQFPFSPVVDGPGGIIPELPSKLLARGQFAHIPFIAGTNLDEGTLFIPITFNSSAVLRQWLVTNSTPSPVSPAKQNFVFDNILDLYPNVPALGSPFGTGNETFGLSPVFKQASAVLTDISFAGLRRQLTQAASARGVKAFGYLFTDPQTSRLPPFLGVTHSSEIVYVYGTPENGPASNLLSQNMIDYWVSFATSLDPNDGRGNASRPVWTRYTPNSERVMELNNENLTMIADNFREKQISFINAHPEALLH